MRQNGQQFEGKIKLLPLLGGCMVFYVLIEILDGMIVVSFMPDTGSATSWLYAINRLTSENDKNKSKFDGCWHADGSGVEGYWSTLSTNIGELSCILGNSPRGNDWRDGVFGLAPESDIGPGSQFGIVSFHYDTVQATSDYHDTHWAETGGPPSFLSLNSLLPNTDRSSYVFTKCYFGKFAIKCRIKFSFDDGTESRFSRITAHVDTGCSHLLMKKDLLRTYNRSPVRAVIFEIEGSEFSVPRSHLEFAAEPYPLQKVNRIGELSCSYKLGNRETVDEASFDVYMGVAVLSAFEGVAFEIREDGNQVGFLR